MNLDLMQERRNREMITEDYVSFETAKLLKEKGFDVPTNYFYNNDGLVCRGCSSYNWNDEGEYDDGLQDYSRPLIWTVMKWLRENHNMFIRIIQSHIEYCTYEVYYDRAKHYESRESYNSYEEACEVAIKYCLNLI